MEPLLDLLLARLCKVSGAEGALLLAGYDGAGAVVLATHGTLAGAEGAHRVSADTFLHECFRTGERRRARSLAETPASKVELTTRLGAVSWLLLPLEGPEGVVGVVLLVARAEGLFAPEADPLLEGLAGALADLLLQSPQKERDQWSTQSDIQQRERLFHTFMEALPGIAYIKDFEGRYLYVNQGVERYWGTTTSHFLGRRDVELMAAEAAEKIRANDEEVLQSRGTFSHEETIPTPEGTPKVWLTTKFPVELPLWGTCVGGISVDITELDEFKARLKRNAEALRNVLDHLAEGVFIHEKGTLVYLNRACLPHFGATKPEEVLGRSLLAFIVEEDHPQLLADVARVQAGTPIARRRRARRLDGSRLIVESHSNRLEFEGRACNIVLLRDVTELTAREEFIDRLASVGTLAAGVAHEINNPLTFLLGNIGFALDRLRAPEPLGEADRGELLELAQEAELGADRIRRIVASLGTLARNNQAKTVVKLSHVLEDVARLTDKEVRGRAEFVRRFDPTPPIIGSETELAQVFVNLVVNAAQAIPAGQPGQRVQLWCYTSREGRAVVEVADTGQGISPEVQDRIFDPFFTTKPVGQGTGLGLAIVRSIVRGFGGNIEVESEPGRGTTFRLSFPPADAPQAPTAEAPVAVAPSVPPPKREEKRRILVVDDEDAMGRVLGRLLKKSYDVLLASNGVEALAVLERERVDAILTDLQMPKLDGAGLYHEVERRFPELAPRLLFMSGGTPSPVLSEFLRAHPDRLVEKPIDPKELQSRLAELLRA